MKKIFYIAAALALVSGVSVSCQVENPIENKTEKAEYSTFNFTAKIAETKVAYEEDNTTHNLQPSWVVDDVVIGFDGSGNTYGYTVSAVNNGAATLSIISSGDNAGSAKSNPANNTKMYMIYAPGKKPSDINNKSLTVSIANQSKDVVPALMIASGTVANNSLSLTFENKTAIIAIKNPTMAAASTNYTSIALSGTGLNTDVVFNLDGSNNLQATYQTTGTITKAVEFTSNASTKKGAAVTYITTCPITSVTDLTFTANNGESFAKTGKSIAAGAYTYMTPTFVALRPVLLSGEFSVSATKKVKFTRANLFWDGTAFHIEDNQTDHPTSWDTNHVGTFFWTKSSGNSYASSYNDGNNTRNDHLFCDGSDASHYISVDGQSGLYVLSWNEWNYLKSTRTNAASLSKLGVSVTNNANTYTNCCIFAPDGFTGTLKETYSLEELNNEGLVCLPTIGKRNGTTIEDHKAIYYWTSTPYDDGSGQAMATGAETVWVNTFSQDRNIGMAIRLVANAQ